MGNLGHCQGYLPPPSASLDGLRYLRYLGAWMSQVNLSHPLQGLQVTLVFGVAEAVSGESVSDVGAGHGGGGRRHSEARLGASSAGRAGVTS